MTRRSVAVIQARMTSSRLPGKVLLPLAGHPVLWHVVERARRIPGLDGIAVAIPDGDGQGPLAAFVDGLPDVMLVRGPEDDVLSRYIHAAEESRAEIVLRITSDCPVIDPGIAGSVLAACQTSGCYARTSFETGVPLGLDVEAVPVEMLKQSIENAPDAYEREHVTPYIWRRPEQFPAVLIDRRPDRRAWRLTLDEQADYDLLVALFGLLDETGPFFSLNEIEAALDGNLELLRINANVAHTAHVELADAPQQGA